MIYLKADVEGLAKFFDAAPELARTAARLAINTTAERKAMKLFRDGLNREVAFPAGYVNGDRLKIIRRAYNQELEAVISARQRPTSLARFAVGSPPITGKRRGGVSVRVKPGSTKLMPSAFLMRLRAGATIGDNNYNVGLAIRLKPGERIRNKHTMTQLGHNLYLLYGPSVDQVFRDVAAEHSSEIASAVRTEFYRQFERLTDER